MIFVNTGPGRAILETLYHLRRPSPTDLTGIISQQSALPVSYEGVELALDDAVPPEGFHRLSVQREIGTGVERFDQAKAAIIDWAGHRAAGATVQPGRPELVVGGVMALALRIAPLWVTASCRIVEVFDELDRFGFTYATLPHHPASGEERFQVLRDMTTDVVRLEIVAVSRPASPLVRLAGPVGRIMQRMTAARYLDGFEAGAAPTSGNGVADAAADRPPLRPPSFRWWFENRITGELTFAQSPNWPLYAIAGTWIVRLLSNAGSNVHSGAGWLGIALWVYWGADELLRGVNPWRRLLGTLMIVAQVYRLVT